MDNKFEVYLLHRDEVFVKYGDVQAAVNFLTRIGRSALSYSVMARRGHKAIFIEKMINIIDLNKELTEFMVKSISPQ